MKSGQAFFGNLCREGQSQHSYRAGIETRYEDEKMKSNCFSPIAGRLVIQAGKHLAGSAVCALLLSTAAVGQGTAPTVSCESLAKLTLPDTTVTMAQTVPVGQFQIPATPRQGPPPAGGGGPGGPGGPGGGAGGGGGFFGAPPDLKSLPAFCRIAATLKPTSDSDIRIEVWLPLMWNGNLLGVGGGGWAGHIFYTGNPVGLIDGVKAGYASVNTDAGHEGNGGEFIPGHPEKLIDYGYRANHEMTLKAKMLIKAFYGVAQKRSIFVGCSLGSTQALTEAKRFPDDYDGVVAGAPMTPISVFNAVQMWPGWLVYKDPAKFIPTPKYTLIHEAAIKACATPVGLHDGIIEEPDQCNFDPQALQCKGADSPDCLTAPQVELMRQIYTGPVDPKTKKVIFPGVARGAELQLPAYARPEPFSPALQLYRYAVHQDANWDWKTADFFSDIALGRKVLDSILNVDADLNLFFANGGKLMLYIGWTDYHNPIQTIDYYQAVVKKAGAQGRSSVRLFNIPGMDHCSGGAGCDSFDKVAVMAQWLETGKAPEQILTSKLASGKVIRTRPACAYPKVANYEGTGDMDDAANFDCLLPKTNGTL
jgi:feruloyl esterase